MKKYKCIIVDDEPIAIRIVKNHLSNFSEFELISTCNNALEAIKILRKQPIDLIFLDIEMPSLTGLEMIKTLNKVPQIIFITAHRNYAVEAFDVNALDYLLKPVSLERFTQSINRFFSVQSQSENVKKSEELEEWLAIKVDKKHVKLALSDILYIESMADYVIVHLENKKLITKERISQLEEKLLMFNFLRIHRGFIINVSRVNAWYGNTIEIGQSKIPIGRNYKEKVSEKFQF